MEQLQRLMIANGLMVCLVAMLAGFMLVFSLVGGFEVWPGTILAIPAYGTTDGWVRAHTGGVTNGLLVMALAFALPKLDLTPAKEKLVGYGIIYVAWSFTVFYWFGNAAGNRALTLGDNPLGETDWLGVIGFLPALPSVFLVLIVLWIAARSVRSSK